MEIAQDSFNIKINSLQRLKEKLMNLHEEYENERKSAVSDAESLWRSARENQNKDLTETYRIAKHMPEESRINTRWINILANVENIHNKEESDNNPRTGGKKKCRYFNRGFCKYGQKCRFYHPRQVCNEFLLEGICRQHKCPQRHPRHCRYWTTRQEGCNRGDFCQYLHVHEKRYSGEEIEKPQTLFTVYEEENEDPTLTCEHRDRVAGSDYGLKTHRETLT